jgi:hypothetical protein
MIRIAGYRSRTKTTEANCKRFLFTDVQLQNTQNHQTTCRRPVAVAGGAVAVTDETNAPPFPAKRELKRGCSCSLGFDGDKLGAFRRGRKRS